MGLVNKAKALASEITVRGRRASGVASTKLNQTTSSTDFLGRAIDDSRALVSRGKSRIDQGLEQIASSESGRKAGEILREVGSFSAQLPVLSAGADSIRAHHGVDLLLGRLQVEPNNPHINLWLAESLIRSANDLRRLRIAKGISDPASLFVSVATRKVSEFGRDQDATEIRLLKRAWKLAGTEMSADPRNAEMLDVLARVCLSMEQPERALNILRVAVMADPRRPNPRITVARSFMTMGSFREAAHWAESAVIRGSTVGLIYLAESSQILSNEDRTSDLKSRVAAYEQMLQEVKPSDRVDYFGFNRDIRESMAIVKKRQWEKGASTVRKAQRWGRIIRDA
jgi:hypothetical protein